MTLICPLISSKFKCHKVNWKAINIWLTLFIYLFIYSICFLCIPNAVALIGFAHFLWIHFIHSITFWYILLTVDKYHSIDSGNCNVTVIIFSLSLVTIFEISQCFQYIIVLHLVLQYFHFVSFDYNLLVRYFWSELLLSMLMLCLPTIPPTTRIISFRSSLYLGHVSR